MGGRGSSGGVGGIGGNQSAIVAKMPALKGSEKQIKWASEIREQVLKSADLVVKNAEKRGGYTDVYNPSIQGTKFARKSIIEQVQKVESASEFISNRSRMTYEYVNKIALEYDRRKRKK